MQNAQSCLLEIEALSSESSSGRRREILHRVTDLFFLTNDQQSPEDVTTFGTVMERIAYELEVEARAELSDRISSIDKAPRHLVCRLATDDITVAKPVLERSRVLTDDDLVRIAKSKGQTHLHAIAKRDTLAAPVTDVIVERGENPVLLEVTRNQGAEFTSDSLVSLAEKARDDGDLLTALGTRKDLQPGLMVKIKQRVAQRLKAELADKYSSTEMAELDSLIEKGTEALDLEDVKKSNDELKSRAQKDELSEDHVIQLARAQRLPETVHALSVLTDLDDRMVSYCLLNADIAALGIICKANDFKSTTFLVLMQTRNGKNGIPARDVARAMREYEKLSAANANRTLRFLKMRCSAEADNKPAPLPENQNLWRAHNELLDTAQRPEARAAS